MLVLGFALFLILLGLFSSFVWSVEVVGERQLTSAEVLATAAAAGLKPGVLKGRINPEQTEEVLLDGLPLLTWAGVSIRGVKATIEVAERIVPDEEERKPAHLVASKAGQIKEVLVINGYPLVKEGDMVSAGQILISGVAPITTNELGQRGKPVHAKGIVRAIIWYESAGEGRIIEEGYSYTGRSLRQITFKYGQSERNFAYPRSHVYEHYEEVTSVKKLPGWRNINLPVEIVTIKHVELEPETKRRSQKEARLLAEESALEIIASQFPENAVVQGYWFEEVTVGEANNMIKVRAVVETIEDIGITYLMKGAGY
jgi:similar to stage IV sporulation protein